MIPYIIPFSMWRSFYNLKECALNARITFVDIHVRINHIQMKRWSDGYTNKRQMYHLIVEGISMKYARKSIYRLKIILCFSEISLQIWFSCSLFTCIDFLKALDSNKNFKFCVVSALKASLSALSWRCDMSLSIRSFSFDSFSNFPPPSSASPM